MRSTLAPNKNSGDQAVRLGLVGAGRWGQAYIRTLTECHGASLTRLASQNPEAKNFVPESCLISNDWQELIVEDDIDGIIIATPPANHAEIALAAIERGIAIMVEKPLTLSLSEAEALLHNAKNKQAVVLVDHTHLFHPAYCELKKRISGASPIRKIYTHAGQTGPYRIDTSVLWDWAPHDIAMCLDLVEQTPQNVCAVRKNSQQLAEGISERYEINLTFNGGIDAIIEIGNDFSKKTRLLTISTDEEMYAYDDCSVNSLTLTPLLGAQGTITSAINVPNTPPLTCAVKEFVNRIISNNTKTDSLDLGVEVIRVLSQCQNSLTPE